jgi:hypothetical protein
LYHNHDAPKREESSRSQCFPTKGSHRQKPKATVATTGKGNKKTVTDSMQKHGDRPSYHDATMMLLSQVSQHNAAVDPMEVDPDIDPQHPADSPDAMVAEPEWTEVISSPHQCHLTAEAMRSLTPASSGQLQVQ